MIYFNDQYRQKTCIIDSSYNDFLGQSERSSLMTLILKSDMELKVKKQIYQKEPDNKQKQ